MKYISEIASVLTSAKMNKTDLMNKILHFIPLSCHGRLKTGNSPSEGQLELTVLLETSLLNNIVLSDGTEGLKWLLYYFKNRAQLEGPSLASNNGGART